MILYLPLPVYRCNSRVPTRKERKASFRSGRAVRAAWSNRRISLSWCRALHVRADVTDGQLKCYNLPPVKCLALAECAAVYYNEGHPFFSRIIQRPYQRATWAQSMLKQDPIKYLKSLLIDPVITIIFKSHFYFYKLKMIRFLLCVLETIKFHPKYSYFVIHTFIDIISLDVVNTIILSRLKSRDRIQLTNRLTNHYE